VVVDAALIEPVSEPQIPFADSAPLPANFARKSASELSGLQQNSLRDGTGNFWGHNREFF
jgi:hypothetical protein